MSLIRRVGIGVENNRCGGINQQGGLYTAEWNGSCGDTGGKERIEEDKEERKVDGRRLFIACPSLC